MQLNRGWFLLFAIALVSVLSVGAWALIRADAPAPLAGEVQVADALNGDSTEGFARAIDPRSFHFPADHGPHLEFRSEWWYYTGNLTTADGRAFGYQLTFFRTALRPPESVSPSPLAPDTPTPSPWHTREIYMAHFAITDVASGKLICFDRFARAAVGLSGATAEPFHVWLENWSATAATSTAAPVEPAAAPETPPMRLCADQDNIGLDLTLLPEKPIALQGDHGLSRKGAAPGQASYYYSLTRMATRGTVRIGSETFSVTGLSWMDREWSTSTLSHEQVGWDWFSLQLADGRDLMYYQLRRTDGSVDPASSGTVTAADGTVTPFASTSVQLQATGTWVSPVSGVRYPSGWHLSLPAQNLDLTVTPRVPNQELNLYVRYWEGAVQVTDNHSAATMPAGAGYVELTGYTANSAATAASATATSTQLPLNPAP